MTRHELAESFGTMFAKRSAIQYGQVVYGLTRKAAAALFDTLPVARESVARIGYANAWTSRSSSSGESSIDVRYRMVRRADFDAAMRDASAEGR